MRRRYAPWPGGSAVSSNRDMAYAVVKKMKAAYTSEGCDWQLAIEGALNELRPPPCRHGVATSRVRCLRCYEESNGGKHPSDCQGTCCGGLP